MPWIKKNLTLVLGGLVGLILLGGSGFFLYSQYSRESTVNTALEEKRTEWNRLNELKPYPNDENIKAVRADATRLDQISAALKESIKPVEVPHVTDTYSLKLLIETTISDLKKEAEEAGVGLPNHYAFTFARLREMPQFESNGIPKIAEQVIQISTICRVLYSAKVHTLDTLRRSPVLKEEGNSSDYLTKKSVTDNWVTRTPYDFSFRAFSGELAEVLKGFAGMSHCVVIKTINVEPTSLPQGSSGVSPGMPITMLSPGMVPGQMTPGARPGGMDPALAARYGLGAGGRAGEGGGAGGMDAATRARYGLGGPGGSGMEQMRSRYGVGGPAAPPPAALSPSSPGMVAPSGPATPSIVLDEKPLRVILQVDFVKPKPPGEAPTKKPAAPRPAATPDAAAAPDPNAAAPAAE